MGKAIRIAARWAVAFYVTQAVLGIAAGVYLALSMGPDGLSCLTRADGIGAMRSCLW